jgi:hypothetical protein
MCLKKRIRSRVLRLWCHLHLFRLGVDTTYFCGMFLAKCSATRTGIVAKTEWFRAL